MKPQYAWAREHGGKEVPVRVKKLNGVNTLVELPSGHSLFWSESRLSDGLRTINGQPRLAEEAFAEWRDDQ